jgi:hypothetical protein
MEAYGCRILSLLFKGLENIYINIFCFIVHPMFDGFILYTQKYDMKSIKFNYLI